MKELQKIETDHWLSNENIKSPFTEKPMILQKSKEVFDYKGRKVEIDYQSYFCEHSGQSFTIDYIDILNLQAIHRTYDALFFNTLVLCEFKVYRLVNIVDDGHDDCYELDPFMGNSLEHHSILTGFIPLIEFLTPTDYNNLVRQWNFNNDSSVDYIETNL